MKLRLRRGAHTLRDMRRQVGDLARDVSTGWGIEHAATGAHQWRVVEPGLQAARFRASAPMSWDINAASYATEWYARLGQMVCYNLSIVGGTTSGTPGTELLVTLPDGLVAARASYAAVAYASEVAVVECNAAIAAGGRVITIAKNSGAAWNTGLSLTTVRFQIWIEVQR